MSKNISSSEKQEIIAVPEYSENLVDLFPQIPDIAHSLLCRAQKSISNIETLLYTAPSFINAVKASVPDVVLQAVLSDTQKGQLASGTVKLMSKKDGSLLASLVNPKTNKVVSNIPLKEVKLSPDLTHALTSYSTQLQMAQIAEEIQQFHEAIEEIRQGQESDRLAAAYSCQQKFLQACSINNPTLKSMALLQLAADAEDSRNALMLSQQANVNFIKNQPESFWGKLVSGSPAEKIALRMDEIRESLCAVNMVSLAEAMAYQELGETEAAKISLKHYAQFIDKTYLSSPGFVERLDMLDSSPENYWSEALPNIEKKICALPFNSNSFLTEGEHDGTEEM